MNAKEYFINLSKELSIRGESNRYREILNNELNLNSNDTLISTSEHIAPFNCAHSLSFLLPFMTLKRLSEINYKNILIIGGALIPLDNSHYPRGFFYPQNDDPPISRLNLFTQKHNKNSPLLLQPISINDIKDSDAFFREYTWIKKYFENYKLYNSYAEQMCQCMNEIASRWFSPLFENVYIYPLELIARRILIKLLHEEDPYITTLLFDDSARAEIATTLNGTFCAWGNRQGTFLFWGRKESRIIRLEEHESYLTGNNIKIKINKCEILDALEKGDIWPGVFLSLLLVSFLPNIPISGGPNLKLSSHTLSIRAPFFQGR